MEHAKQLQAQNKQSSTNN